MNIGIVVATKYELPGLFQSMDYTEENNLRKYHLDGKEIYLLITGLGKKNVQRRLKEFVDSYEFHQIINVGFAGSLKTYIKPTYMVIGNRISCSGEDIIYCDGVLVENAGKILKKENKPFYIGGIWTSQSLVTERGEIPKEFIACDMESYWIGERMKEKKIPYLVVKVITDQASGSGSSLKILKKLFTYLTILKNRKDARIKLEDFLKSYLHAI